MEPPPQPRERGGRLAEPLLMPQCHESLRDSERSTVQVQAICKVHVRTLPGGLPVERADAKAMLVQIDPTIFQGFASIGRLSLWIRVHYITDYCECFGIGRFGLHFRPRRARPRLAELSLQSSGPGTPSLAKAPKHASDAALRNSYKHKFIPFDRWSFLHHSPLWKRTFTL